MTRERTAIEDRRQAAGIDPKAPVMGIALSGGGIRSATFNLGLLQGLASKNLLRHFDYLSTVSGGGYVGGWWTAWLARSARKPEDGTFPPPERIVSLHPGEPNASPAGHDPVRHVRLFSNFLTPQAGALSPDTWRAVAIATRNLALTWLLLLPVLFAALCLAQVAFTANPKTGWLYLASSDLQSRLAVVGPAFKTVGLALAVLVTLLTSVWLLVSVNFARSLPRLIGAAAGQGMFLGLILVNPRVSQAIGWTQSLAVTGALLSLALTAIYVPLEYIRALSRLRDVARNRIVRVHAWVLFTFLALLAVLGFAAFGDLVVQFGLIEAEGYAAKAGGAAGLLASIGSALFSAVKMFPKGGADSNSKQPPSATTRITIALAPYLVILGLALIGSYLARLAIRATLNDLMEWVIAGTLAGIAFCLILALTEMGTHTRKGWIVGVASALLAGVWSLRGLISSYPRAAVLGVIALLVVAVMARLLGPSPAEVVEKPLAPAGRRAVLAAGALALVGFAVAIVVDRAFWFAAVPERYFVWNRGAVTLLLIATLAIAFGLQQRLLSRGALLVIVAGSAAATVLAGLFLYDDDNWVSGTTAVLCLAGTSLSAAVGLGWMIDPNLISLHGFYRARLVRAYMGASNLRRAEQQADITDAVKGDDVRLADARTYQSGGPYHLINTTLNLSASTDLATSRRVSTNFILSPLYCGSDRTGFRRTDQYMGGQLSVGTAVAISGAAASPEAGTLRFSTAVAMLFTLLNVRLGFWAPNPAKGSWRSPQARLWTFYTLREFFSRTDGKSSYCFLSDGGHYENSAIYELAQRACKLIVVSDCGQDPRPASLSDLGNAVRMCRLDFGAELDIDMSQLTAERPAPVVVGTIRYADEHLRQIGIPEDELPSRREGMVIWVKPTKPAQDEDRDVPADVLQYSRAQADFPQQSTGDLAYDEAQFESYRKLGSWTANLAAAQLSAILGSTSVAQPSETQSAAKVG